MKINSNKKKSPASNRTVIILTILNITLFGGAMYTYFSARKKMSEAVTWREKAESIMAFSKTRVNPTALATELPILTDSRSAEDPVCTDPVWCSIPMPEVSHYSFDPPIDKLRWKLAQSQAASGEQVLLKRISKEFPHPFDFLDGDKSFRKIHNTIDVFIDSKEDFQALLPGGLVDYNRRLKSNEEEVLPEDTVVEYSQALEKELSRRKLRLTMLEGARPGKEQSVDKRSVVPSPYDFRAVNRAPVVQIGYIAFKKDGGTYFSGNFMGGVFIKRVDFLTHWAAVKNKIDTPFVALCVLNENWGWLSTMFPNRTAGWGKCCDKTDPLHKNLYDFLDDKKTLMLAVGQHSNISHPKILTIPRGIPLTWKFTSQMMWDSIRTTLNTVKKTKLLFASTSSWGKRPQMLHCISQKVPVSDFEGHDETPAEEMKKTKVDRRRYYEKLGGAMFGVCLPGLGYDTFRMWELLTLGTVVVVERAVGFDRTLWRLPALLVDDFDDVTPALLRSAYVEALYLADQFEFKRLTQGYWTAIVANVSATKNTQTLLDAFPMQAEKPNFARPRVPYACGLTDTCGAGTKSIPKSSC